MKKILKILFWTVGILVVLIVLAVIGLKLFFPAEKIRALAVEKGSATLGREIAVEGLDISVWGGLGVELQNVRIGNPEGMDGPDFFTADYIDLKLQLLPLLSGDIQVDRLIIEAPTVRMRKSASGDINYAFASADSTALPTEAAEVPPEGQAAALAISFEELEISGGRISFQDDSSGISFELSGVDLATSLEYPRAGFYQSTGRLRADSVRVAIPEVYPSVAFELNYRVSYDMASGNLIIERAGTVINKARFKVTGELGNVTEVMSVSLNIQSEQISISDLLSLLPTPQRAMLADYTIDGSFTLDADLRNDSPAEDVVWYYTGTAVLRDLAIASESFDGDLRIGRCLVDFKPDNLRMNIEDGSFDGQPLKGHLVVDDFDNPRISGELAGGLDLALLAPFLPVGQGHQVAGRCAFDLKFSGPIREPESLIFTGNLQVSDGRYSSAIVPEPIETFSLDAYFDNRLLKIRELSCRFASGQLRFAGRITDLVSYLLADSGSTVSPDIEATMDGVVDLAMAEPFLTQKGAPELSGELAVDVSFAANLSDLSSFSSQGTITVSNAAYTDSLLPEPIEHFDAQLSLRPDTIEVIRLNARMTSSDVTFEGSLIRPFPYFLPIIDLNRNDLEKPLFLFALSSHRFDSDKLFPEAVPGSGSKAVAFTADSVSAVILPDIDGRGTFKADTVIYSGVELTGVTGKIRIHNRRIECYDASANVYSGSVSGKTTIDLSDFNNPHYTGEFSATRIETNDFVTQFSGFGGHLYGKGNLTGSYDAHGWEPEAFLNSLTMDGDLEVRDGRLVTSGAVFSALTELASRMGKSFDKEQPLKGFASKIKARNGRVSTDQMTGKMGDIGDFKLDGSYGFDETLDYVGTIILSEAGTRKLGLKNIGRLELPMKIGGTISSPKLEIDYSSLARQVGENLLKDAAKDLLNGLFKKKKK